MSKSNPTATGRRPTSPGARGSAETVLTPKEALGMLRRHLWLILFMTLIGGAVGTGGWYLIRRYLPLYRAETAIKVLPPIDTDPMNIVVAQVQQDIRYGHRVSLANLMKSQSTLQELLQRDEVRGTKWWRQTMNGREDPVRAAVKAVRCLERNLTAFPHREAEHIQVSMTCGSPGEAALLVNQMVNLFVYKHGETQRGDIRQRLAEVTQRQSAVEQEIRQGEADLQNVTRRTGITDLDQPTGRYFQHTITLRLNELDRQESNLSLGIRQFQADIGNLRQLAEGPITEQIQQLIEGDPLMVWLAQQQAALEAQLSSQLTKFGETHRVVRQARERIEEVRSRREQRRLEIAEQTRRANLMNARDALRVLEERLAELQKLRAAALEEQKRLDEARSEYERIVKTRDERVETLNQIKMQIEKYRILLDDPQTPKVQSVGLAPEPLEMVLSRHILLWVPGGTMLGLILGLSLALLVEMLNDLVRTPSDVRRFLPVPLLGIIPDAYEDHAVDDVDLCDVVQKAPDSLLGESYRRCRTNLELLAGEPFKTLLIASGQAGDGKTSMACNLAAAFAAKYERVLLIDANLRQPSVHIAFASEDADDDDPTGLTNVLTGECAVSEAIRPSNVAGLDLLHAGPPVGNPAELLAGPGMKDLIESAAREYDRIILDSPPVLLVSDAKILARLAEATLLLCNAATTQRGAAERAIFELEDVGANLVGCVLFGAEALKGGYFRRQFRAYRRYLKPRRA
ncbi:MAG: polysaccharide biosynthesis tyrosine autokinase [Planctomycetes bacterium]|nr:polysaccharide biosynthesis tyrosine autokinase [Planctomycetota bacterium]